MGVKRLRVILCVIGCFGLGAFGPGPLGAGSVGADDDPTWTIEGSLLGGRHDNFFFRGPGSPAPSSDLIRLSADGERVFDRGASELTVLGQIRTTQVLDIDEADYHSVGGGLELKRGPLKYALGYERLINRLFSESGERVFFDADTIEGWARYSLSPRWWIRAEAGLDRWDFDPAENDRDSDTVELGLTVRYAVSDRLGIRGSMLWEDRDATGPEQDRESSGFALALEGRPRDDLDAFFRWRQRDRDYINAPFGTRNFGREDTVDDFVLNLVFQLDARMGLLLLNEYREGDSTRPDRNYDGHQILAGVSYRLTGGGS